jgi:hypothetical protein
MENVGRAPPSPSGGATTTARKAKGDTGVDAGLDVDTMLGQLLRRMEDIKAMRWAVVAPSKVVPKVMRIPREVLDRLGIEVYGVTSTDEVKQVAAHDGP